MSIGMHTPIVTDFYCLGEMVDAVIEALAKELNFIVTSDLKKIAASAAGEELLFQIDRAAFAKEASRQIASLETQESVTQSSVPQHRPEFGGLEPPV